MKNKFIEKMKKTLTDQKTELNNKTYHSYTIDASGDETDSIQANILDSINKQLSLRDIAKLNQIEKALNKIENNTYGLCEECEEKIAERRLDLMPYCSICIACAEQIEFEAKHKLKS